MKLALPVSECGEGALFKQQQRPRNNKIRDWKFVMNKRLIFIHEKSSILCLQFICMCTHPKAD